MQSDGPISNLLLYVNYSLRHNMYIHEPTSTDPMINGVLYSYFTLHRLLTEMLLSAKELLEKLSLAFNDISTGQLTYTGTDRLEFSTVDWST
ncbi:hypothetical protein NPIL_37101 [Nephila pilipes]|uniref:Uncharacterized protein n=1 Tax=Nephila pilipes TaxID=299642 RepID=A0A8X6R014_NEPPI|nr:hypothetical protein NPIL_37101 [Nephila pilipes]